MAAKNALVSEVKDAIEVLRLNKTKMAEIAGRESATKWGIAIIVFPLVVNLLLSVLSFPSGFGAIFSRFLIWPVVIPVLSFVGSVYAISFAAEKLFKGKGAHIRYFRVVAYGGIVTWLSIIPYLLGALTFGGLGLMGLISLVSLIWLLVVAYHALQIEHKINQQDAIISMVVGVLTFLILQAVLGSVLVGKYYRYY